MRECVSTDSVRRDLLILVVRIIHNIPWNLAERKLSKKTLVVKVLAGIAFALNPDSPLHLNSRSNLHQYDIPWYICHGLALINRVKKSVLEIIISWVM